MTRRSIYWCLNGVIAYISTDVLTLLGVGFESKTCEAVVLYGLWITINQLNLDDEK